MMTLIDFPIDDGGRLHGRFGTPREVLTAWHLDDVVPLLQDAQDRAQNDRWVVGIVAYEAGPAFDPAFKVASAATDFPLAAFLVFDGIADIAGSTCTPGRFSCTPWRHDTAYAAFERTVETIRDQIAAGDYYQTNFTTRLTAGLTGDPEAFFHSLCAAQPGSYALYLDLGAWQIASVSPELFFAWNPQTGELKTRPMKGTAPSELGAETLKSSAKDRAENLMIVDLLRNDISRIGDDVRVSDLFAVQALPTALQMTSTVTGITRLGMGLPEVFGALFPCGSVTGAPKIAAMQAIAAYETSRRGAYCGALGVIQPGGEAIFSVGIRTVTISNGKASCGVGSGITWDSQCKEEFAEGRIKQRFLWRASASFDLLETLLLESGVYWLLQRHIDRIRRSASHFGFVFDEARVRSALDAVARNHPLGVFRVRLLVDRTGRITTEAFVFKPDMAAAKSMPFPPASETAKRVALAKQPISSDDEFLRHKTTHRAVYDAFAPDSTGLLDTLLYNERGEITEFTRGNVVAELDGELVTPAVECCLLPGTLRAELLANWDLSEHVFTRNDLQRATGLWFINGLRGIIPVHLNVSTFAW